MRRGKLALSSTSLATGVDMLHRLLRPCSRSLPPRHPCAARPRPPPSSLLLLPASTRPQLDTDPQSSPLHRCAALGNCSRSSASLRRLRFLAPSAARGPALAASELVVLCLLHWHERAGCASSPETLRPLLALVRAAVARTAASTAFAPLPTRVVKEVRAALAWSSLPPAQSGPSSTASCALRRTVAAAHEAGLGSAPPRHALGLAFLGSRTLLAEAQARRSLSFSPLLPPFESPLLAAARVGPLDTLSGELDDGLSCSSSRAQACALGLALSLTSSPPPFPALDRTAHLAFSPRQHPHQPPQPIALLPHLISSPSSSTSPSLARPSSTFGAPHSTDVLGLCAACHLAIQHCGPCAFPRALKPEVRVATALLSFLLRPTDAYDRFCASRRERSVSARPPCARLASLVGEEIGLRRLRKSALKGHRLAGKPSCAVGYILLSALLLGSACSTFSGSAGGASRPEGLAPHADRRHDVRLCSSGRTPGPITPGAIFG